jgi:WS/DGAT/MGAT family acyltransferase
MSAQASGDRLSALDAAFYYLERTGQLLHVGGVYVVERALDFDRLVADIRGRLHLIPRYVQRVVPVPFNLAHPTWERDPHFDFRHHLFQHRLRPPGDEGQLVGLVGRLFAQPLHRGRPLWELHQIDGYQGERSVLFAKVHHCMIDGVSGVQLLAVMFDPTPNPPPVPPPEPGDDDRRPLPSVPRRLARALREGVAAGSAHAHTLLDWARNPRRAVADVSDAADAVAQLLRVFLAPTPRTPFNGHVSTLRRVLWTTLSLHDAKGTKNRLGGTVNDVVLTVITGALRAYLEARGFSPDRMELRAMLPVNVRAEHEHLHLGNRVSMMVAPLPVGIRDPLERYHQVCTATTLLKRSGQAGRMSRVIDLLALLPPPLQKPLGWVPVQTAPVNTICTNVPGPAVSLYVQGKRLEVLVPIVPLAQGVGLAFAILSYADAFTIGITFDPALVQDAERLPGLLQEAAEELRRLAGVERPERTGPVRSELRRRREGSTQVA